MSRKALETVTDLDFEVVKEYFATGESKALSEENQRMVRICRNAWGLMQKYPQRNVLINELMAQEGLTYKAAKKYVDFTRATWGSVMDYNVSFLKTFFENKLMEELNDPRSKPEVRAKNLATLQKHIQNTPQSEIDPTLMEANQIVINIDLGGRNIQIPQERLRELPQDIQELFLGSVSNEITEDAVFEIVNS